MELLELGKSKFAIELAKLYSDKNDYSFLCIGNKGIPIWEDLKTNASDLIKIYVLLVDDANRLAKNFQWILSLFEERSFKNFKGSSYYKRLCITSGEVYCYKL